MRDFLKILPPAPPSQDNTFGIRSWGMMLNDQLGDCTIAAPGHLVQMFTASRGTEITVPDSVILSAYKQWDGYTGDPSTDNGGIIADVLADWQAQGLGGHKIIDHAPIEMNQFMLQNAIYIFGGINGGVELPITAQNQVGQVWDVVGDGSSGDAAPGSWGGHSVAIVKYDTSGLTCVTWGDLQVMTWRFFMQYFDEAWAIISPDWNTPLSTTQLESDLQAVSGGSIGNMISVSFPPFIVNP